MQIESKVTDLTIYPKDFKRLRTVLSSFLDEEFLQANELKLSNGIVAGYVFKERIGKIQRELEKFESVYGFANTEYETNKYDIHGLPITYTYFGKAQEPFVTLMIDEKFQS